MKERLIELLNVHQDYGTKHFFGEETEEIAGISNEIIADSIIGDGWIRPPCKVGNVVYVLWETPTLYTETKYVIYCAEVKKISQYNKNCRLTTVFELEPIEFRGRRKEYYIDDFGKTVFLTKEEAEQKLKERKEDKNE